MKYLQGISINYFVLLIILSVVYFKSFTVFECAFLAQPNDLPDISRMLRICNFDYIPRAADFRKNSNAGNRDASSFSSFPASFFFIVSVELTK